MSNCVSVKITSPSQKPKFVQLILWKIINFFATMSNFKAKMQQNRFRLDPSRESAAQISVYGYKK